MPSKVPGTQRGMARRRSAVLNAAKSLIEESGGTDFKMSELGARSGVSVQTIYNLCGPKSSVLYMLLNEIIDSVRHNAFKRNGKNGVDIFLNAVNVVGDFYISNPILYKSLLRYLFGVNDPIYRPVFIDNGRTFWRHALDPIFQESLESDISLADLAENMLHLTTGVLETWIHDEVNDTQFGKALRHGAILNLLALDLSGTRDHLLAELVKAR